MRPRGVGDVDRKQALSRVHVHAPQRGIKEGGREPIDQGQPTGWHKIRWQPVIMVG